MFMPYKYLPSLATHRFLCRCRNIFLGSSNFAVEKICDTCFVTNEKITIGHQIFPNRLLQCSIWFVRQTVGSCLRSSPLGHTPWTTFGSRPLTHQPPAARLPARNHHIDYSYVSEGNSLPTIRLRNYLILQIYKTCTYAD